MIFYVLGVDPGAVSGWALVGPGARPIDWGRVGGPGRPVTGREIYEVLQRIGPKIRAQWPPMLAIEGQFVLQGGGKGEENWGQTLATMKTARHTGKWMGVCERYGLPVYEHNGQPGIQPQAWRSAVWGRRRWNSEQSKKHAVEMAAATWRIRVLKSHHHTAEAMWIGAYAWGELAAHARQGDLGLE